MSLCRTLMPRFAMQVTNGHNISLVLRHASGLEGREWTSELCERSGSLLGWLDYRSGCRKYRQLAEPLLDTVRSRRAVGRIGPGSSPDQVKMNTPGQTYSAKAPQPIVQPPTRQPSFADRPDNDPGVKEDEDPPAKDL